MTTLREIREEVARGLGVRTFVDGATPTLGTFSILPDNSRLEPDGEWSDVDSYILFTSGANDGVVRRVTGFSTGQALAYGPSLAAVPSGTTYQLFKTYHPVEDLNIAINDAIRELGVRRVTSIGTTAEVSTERRLAVPSAIGNTSTQILAVERSVGTLGSSHDYETLQANYHYEMVRSDGASWLELGYAPTSGTIVRFHYIREADKLTADTDSVSEPVLLIKALARKYLALANRDAQAADIWAREAERIRRDVVASVQPGRKTVVTRISVW